MKDIEGIEHALKVLAPYWKGIEDDFNRNNDIFLSLAAMDHDPIGWVLRTHLIVEHFLGGFIADFYALEDLDSLKLTFAQKAKLIPTTKSGAAFVRPGIIQLNSIRNKFGHRLDFRMEGHELSAIYEVLQQARPGVTFQSPVQAIEAFGPVACAFLTVVPSELREVFQQAFTNLRSYTPHNDEWKVKRLSRWQTGFDSSSVASAKDQWARLQLLTPNTLWSSLGSHSAHRPQSAAPEFSGDGYLARALGQTDLVERGGELVHRPVHVVPLLQPKQPHAEGLEVGAFVPSERWGELWP